MSRDLMFNATVALGAAAVLGIALAPLYAPRLHWLESPLLGSKRLGAAFIALALGIAMLCMAAPGVMASTESALFLGSFLLLLAGAVIMLGGREPKDPPDEEADEPPWWPEFDDCFRSYARRNRPLARIR